MSTNALIEATVGKYVEFIGQFAFLGEVTHFVKVPQIDASIAPVAASMGMDLMLIKYTLSLFLVYPMAAIMYALPNKTAKNLFSLIAGVVLVQWIYGADWIHTFVSSIGTYLICALGPRKYIHYIAFFWVMSYMTGAHAYRMYVSYMSGEFDHTGTQMVLTMKLTSFAYNLFDGTYDRSKVFPEQEYEDVKKKKLYGERRKFAITQLPNILDFLGYVYCFTCILAGPAFEYTDYLRTIDDTAFVQEDAVTKQKVLKKPNAFLPGLKSLIIGVVCLVGHMKLSAVYSLKSMYNAEFIAATTFGQRVMHMFAALFAERLKYYFAWKVAEGASVMGGFGFEGFGADGKSKGFRGVENIDIGSFETATNVQTLSRAWNKRTQGWLERYTYSRSGNSLLMTYFISALWHGLYPGFFIMFLTVPIMTNIERLVRAKINPLVVPAFDGRDLKTYPNTLGAKLYWLACWALTTASINYVVLVFSMGSLENSLRALGGMKFVGHIGLILVYVVLELFPKKKKTASDAKVAAKKAQ